MTERHQTWKPRPFHIGLIRIESAKGKARYKVIAMSRDRELTVLCTSSLDGKKCWAILSDSLGFEECSLIKLKPSIRETGHATLGIQRVSERLLISKGLSVEQVFMKDIERRYRRRI